MKNEQKELHSTSYRHEGCRVARRIGFFGRRHCKIVHEVWSEGRMKDGWECGEERNDTKRQHPCLVPYEELTEEEKNFDRKTSQETLKLIIKLGFKIMR